MKRLLITGGGGAGTEALVRLWNAKYDVHFADSIVDAIPHCVPKSNRHEIPLAQSSDFTTTISKLVRQLNVDILIPTVDEELLQLAMHADIMLPCKLLLPQPEFVHLMLDKYLCMQEFLRIGISAPATSLMSDTSDVGFPCIAKPRKGRGSRSVHLVKNKAQLAALEILLAQSPSDVILQPYLTGEEYTVTMCSDQLGQLRAIVPVRVKEKRGVTIDGVTSTDKEVINYCRSIHEAFKPFGCYNIQLIKSSSGIVTAFEVNPRVSTTFCLSIAAGIDPVQIFLNVDANRYDLLPFDSNVGLRRFWANFFY